MSDSGRPHRRQRTRLRCPWDSPGKNTGVDCYFLLQCIKLKSEREVAQSCLTLHNPMDCSLPGPFVHGILQARVLEWVAMSFSSFFYFVVGENSYIVILAKIAFIFSFVTHTHPMSSSSSPSYFYIIFWIPFNIPYIWLIYSVYYYLSYLECKLQVQRSLSVLLIDAFQISRWFLSHHNHLINIY